MKLGLSVDEVLTTTRSVRKRLDFDRPVERSVVEECLEIALQAPTGSNFQGWNWVVVEDEEKKRRLGDIYLENYRIYADTGRSRSYQPGDLRYDQREKISESATYLAENFHRAPLLLIPCIEGRLDGVPAFVSASAWGSLLPAVWSFMLALRERGLGSAWTTIHLMRGGEQQAAELLGIPYDTVTQGGLFPIAHTVGTDFRPAKRLPLADVLHWDAW
jgi:nitroreductase